MKGKIDHIQQLLNKKLAGELKLSEENEFINWLTESSENELLFRRMLDVWQKGHYTARIKGQQTSFKKISRQLDIKEGVFEYKSLYQNRYNWKRWYRIAATIVFLLTAISIFYFMIPSPEIEQKIAHSEMIIKCNPAGQKTEINLPDGSVCWLNSESEIKFYSNFSSDTRSIYLKGEAYFEVAKDINRPFKVHAPTMTITALGTAFNINSFPEKESELVALIEGRISVNCEDKFYDEVFSGEAISFNKEKKSSERLVVVTPNEAIAWKDGVLDFNEETYQTIFAKLERWYGVSISISGNPPAHLRYKARFKNELLVNILESISYGHDFDYKIDGKKIKIMFN